MWVAAELIKAQLYIELLTKENLNWPILSI